MMFAREEATKLNIKGHAKPSALHEDVHGLRGSAVCHGLRLSLETLEVRHIGSAHAAPWMCKVTACAALPV